jgi:hypothetical protein
VLKIFKCVFDSFIGAIYDGRHKEDYQIIEITVQTVTIPLSIPSILPDLTEWRVYYYRKSS